MRKIWGELEQGHEWVLDADLKDFFGSADRDKLMELVNQRVSDGRVLNLIGSMLKADHACGNGAQLLQLIVRWPPPAVC